MTALLFLLILTYGASCFSLGWMTASSKTRAIEEYVEDGVKGESA